MRNCSFKKKESKGTQADLCEIKENKGGKVERRDFGPWDSENR
jgi:hypothetical protein